MTDIDKRLDRIERLLSRPPGALWSRQDIAAYFGYSEDITRQMMASKTFPKPVIPGHKRARWEPKQVRGWAENYGRAA